MAFKAKQLRAKHQIIGVLKDKKPIEPGTFFEAKDEATEKHLLSVGAAEVAELPEAPKVEKAAPARKAPAKKAAPKPKPAPKAEEGNEGNEGNEDLV